MKKLIIASLLLLSSCAKETTNTTGSYEMPPEMEGCKVFYLQSTINHLYVVHCPHANTTTKHSCGKNCTRSNTVISE